MKAGAIREIKAHEFERQEEEHYVEERWCDTALFGAMRFQGAIHDPCCGFGRIPLAARAAGYEATGGDIVDRGFPGVVIEDFLGEFLRPDGIIERHDNVVMNPPFNICRPFIVGAVGVAQRKVASIFPTKRLNAAHWLRALPLTHVWYLTPRPSMPPGHVVSEYEARGKRPSGGKEDFSWLIFDRAHKGGSPEVGWLHRDRGLI